MARGEWTCQLNNPWTRSGKVKVASLKGPFLGLPRFLLNSVFSTRFAYSRARCKWQLVKRERERLRVTKKKVWKPVWPHSKCWPQWFRLGAQRRRRQQRQPRLSCLGCCPRGGWKWVVIKPISLDWKSCVRMCLLGGKRRVISWWCSPSSSRSCFIRYVFHLQPAPLASWLLVIQSRTLVASLLCSIALRMCVVITVLHVRRLPS